MIDAPTPTLFVVSDGRGDTCKQVLEAALVQFPTEAYQIVVWPEVRTAEQVDSVIAAAVARDASVFYTLVSDETRQEIQQRAQQLLVPLVDLLGPAFSALHDVFTSDALAKPGLFYASDHEHFDRHAAIDYTLNHDDGQRADELDQADVVIVGVSRASKSTTCFTLAYRGIKAANVPLIADQMPPKALQRLDPLRVIGLRINVSRLMTVREARSTHLGLAHTGYYVDKREVAREIRHAHDLMDRFGWRSFDASYMAIEEIAREVMRLRGETSA
ncbi:kinase/pyrophosphorylase [bacterium]|nr:kinase/pyrophosphorylase [bacterium]MBU1072511.1 kinase/pyrophosphorylase [bacterium]MBU1676540.1 kinase/pyrophosphorylase [bacterium]